MAYSLESFKEPAAGVLGAGTGLVVPDLAAEYTARVTAQTGYMKAAVKTIVKVIIALLLFGIAARLKGGRLTTIFIRMMAYAGLGSIIPDWITAQFPGGIPGLAQQLAITSATYSTGGAEIVSEISRIETARASTGAAGQTYVVA